MAKQKALFVALTKCFEVKNLFLAIFDIVIALHDYSLRLLDVEIWRFCVEDYDDNNKRQNQLLYCRLWSVNRL